MGGRSEDASKLTWDRITKDGEQGRVDLAAGKTSAKRLSVLSKKTMNLLDQIRTENNKNGAVFSFSSAHNLRVYLKRKIVTIELPEENEIDVHKW